MYKLLAFDIDGTLLDDQHRLSEKTKRMVRKAYDRGYIIAMASGRGPLSVFPIMEELEIDGPLITHNGAVIVHSRDRSIWHQEGFFIRELLPIITYCRDHGLVYDVNTAFEVYTEFDLTAEQREVYRRFFLDPVKLEDMFSLKEPVLKLTIFGSDEQITRALGDLNPYADTFHIVRSSVEFIDVMHERAVKGIALKSLCQKVDVPLSQTVAIGNYYNDLLMLREAGLGLAVANAPKDVQEAADRVIPSNNEEGVARFLEQLLV